ncbi:serine-type D-Ala-D-Ala carboxypeptidase [Emticicia aquatilis]|uniref:Serine-type D-Ala-D-Ala carboxypeptidase n=1 Tax=Emticicia aquatilis TaxID=1537369 RepID=A0A916Z3B0_9BACT|nr:serine hydrolase domain-containing protein [Emticicia aquatilis]GGD71618.1 serine-type D-Ala-D-Ala carboxypeptidase [Emticicia aquatilis]
MKIIQLLGIATLFLLVSCEQELPQSTAQNTCSLANTNHPKAAQYQKIIDKFMQAGAVGVSITVKSPEGLWSSAAGKADLANNINLSPCHTLRMGSISKTFTSATILKLQEEGKLNINDLASKYLPEEVTKNVENLDKATIRNLLQHTSGVHEYLGISGILAIKNFSLKHKSAAENIKSIYGKKAQFEVGKEWSYANSNYLLLSLIIENITKKSSYEVVTEKVIRPLGLKNTYASTTLPSSLSNGYYDSFNNGMMVDQTEIDNNAVGGQDMLDGGLISNSYDLAILMEALKTGKLLSAKSVAEMELPIGFYVEVPEDLNYIKDYGLGLFKLDIDGKKGIGHGGNVFSFNCIAYYFPEQKISVSIMLNSYSKKLQKALYDVETLKMVF